MSALFTHFAFEHITSATDTTTPNSGLNFPQTNRCRFFKQYFGFPEICPFISERFASTIGRDAPSFSPFKEKNDFISAS